MNTCNWCGGAGHWERDCRKRLRSLSKEEAQSERRRIAVNKKEEAEAAKRNTPSVSATAQEPPSDSSSGSSISPTYVTVASASIDSVTFYIAHESQWMLDSGCSDHITHEISDFSEYCRLNTPQYVRLADRNTRVAFVGVGTVSAMTQIQGVMKYITLENVIHSPDLGGRFISIRKVGEKGISTTFLGNTATLHKEGIDYAEGHLLGQQYWLTLRSRSPSANNVQKQVPIEVLHARLGHLSWSTLKKLKDQIEPSTKRTLMTCEGCLLGKSTRRIFKTSHTRRTTPFTLVHMDLAGPMQTQSIQGNFYHYIIVDDYSQFKWVFFLRTKSQAFEHFQFFLAFVSTQFNANVKAARSDRGGEFLSTEFTKLMEAKGIEHQLTAPHTPQQNGVAERTNRTVASTARALLQTAGMTNGFWECAIATAVHARNRAPSRVNKYTSPHEKLFGQRPDLSYLRVFGCLAYRHITSVLEPVKLLVFGMHTQSPKSFYRDVTNKKRNLILCCSTTPEII